MYGCLWVISYTENHKLFIEKTNSGVKHVFRSKASIPLTQSLTILTPPDFVMIE